MARNLKSTKPRFEAFYPFALWAFVGFCIADLGILAFRQQMLPNSAPPSSVRRNNQNEFATRNTYTDITGRNFFASNGEIPDAIYDKSKGDLTPKDNAPVLTQLPLNLIGTLVHSNPMKSLAAIEVRGKPGVISYTVDKEIENLAKVTSIERQKVIFRNLSSNVLEYIEMKKDGKLAFGASRTNGAGDKEVQKVSENSFVVKKSDVLKYTSNLSSLLMDAATTPSRDPGTGAINGFRILDMKPGSIFEQLGLERMDVIRGVNGTPITSPTQAMESYNALKNASSISVQIERNGKSETMTYNIQ